MNQPLTMMQNNTNAKLVKAFLLLLQNLFKNGNQLVRQFEKDGSHVLNQGQQFYDELKPQIEMTRNVLKGTPRYKKILGTGISIVASYKALATKKEFLNDAQYQDQISTIHQKNAQKIYDLCVDLRGGLIKLAQFLSTRQDILPPEYVQILSGLQDKVPPASSEQVIARVEKELGGPWQQFFKEFDTQPLAAASLAQVHKAVCLDGTAVAVKVQSPGIEDIIDIDMSALKVCGWMFKELFPQLDINTILSELVRSIRAELDYTHELSNMERFRSTLDYDKAIHIPKPLPSLSTSRIITMELVAGERLTDYLDQAQADGRDEDVSRIIGTMVNSFCAQIFQHSHYHADPHPGNFLVGTEGNLVMLDFGSIQDNPRSLTDDYRQLTLSVLAQNKDEAATILKSMGFETQDGSADTLIEFAQIMLELFQQDPEGALADIDPKAQMEELLMVIRKNPVVKVPEHFVMLGRVFSSLAGLFFHYRPQINLFEIIFPYIIMTQPNTETQ